METITENYSIILNRVEFYNRYQNQEESLLDYLIDIYKLSRCCEFNEDADFLIRDRFVIGMNNQQLQEAIFALDGNPTLEEVMHLCGINKTDYENGKIVVDSLDTGEI